jgi:uncharacterized protein
MLHWSSPSQQKPATGHNLLQQAMGALFDRLCHYHPVAGHPPVLTWLSQFIPVDRAQQYQRVADRYRAAAATGNPRALRKMAHLYEHGLASQDSDLGALAGYRRAAEQNDRCAQFIVGYFYEHGIGVPPDVAQAIPWYRRSEAQHFGLAAWRLGLCYQYGRGVAPNAHEAAWHFARAARYFHGPALIELGHLHEQGRLLSGNPRRARKAFRIAGWLGQAAGYYHQGRYLESGLGGTKDLSKAVRFYRKAARQEHPEALFRLGMLHLQEPHLSRGGKGIHWLQRAAQAGQAEAKYQLALCYQNGQGVPQDASLALKWLLAAALQGYAPAAARLRQINQAKVQEDRQRQAQEEAEEKRRLAQEEAEEQRRQAEEAARLAQERAAEARRLAEQQLEATRQLADQGHPDAQRQLAQWYAEGTELLPQDWQQAVCWYERAAGQGTADAQYALAMLYLDKDAADDKDKAFQWFKNAADQGHADAWNRLGKCYIEGWGTGRDFTQAMTCYRKAARLGSATAHHRIGLMYLEGEFIEQNEAAGYKWLEKAAALGDADADALLLEKYRTDKGKLAEYLVHKQLLALARQDPATYRYFDEVVFLEKDGENSSETDHVMVCPAGIIVIETKNWGGIIHGRKEDRNWAAEMHNGQMRPHLNPLQQNKEHVDTFKRKLGGHQPIDSLIVFYKPTFGNEMPDNIISLDALPEYFTGQPARLSPPQIEAIAGRIDALRAKDPDAKEEHVRRLKIRQQKWAQRQEAKWREIDDGKVS